MDRQYESRRSKMSAIEVEVHDPFYDKVRHCDESHADEPYMYNAKRWKVESALRQQIMGGYSNVDFSHGKGPYLEADDPRFTGYGIREDD
jgi:hypothetical protein